LASGRVRGHQFGDRRAELIPARLRGRIDLIVNGSYWIGAATGAAATILLLKPDLLPVDLGWRLGFGIGGLLGLTILILRRHVPENPRWLVTHGYEKNAEKVVSGIEERVCKETHQPTLEEPGKVLTIHPRKTFGFRLIGEAIISKYRERSALALSLMVAQAFLYNAVFFTYGLVLTQFYGVPAERIGLYLLPLAIGNFLGALLLGRFFDTIGRRRMISITFGLAGLLLIATGVLFASGRLSDVSQTVAWTVIFFFASAASSSAYLTASEIFPLETRALAIAVFYAGHCHWRHCSSLALRHANRYRLPLECFLRILRRGPVDDGRGGHGDPLRRRRRRPCSRRNRRAPVCLTAITSARYD
jgi:MFS family permease